MELTEVVLKMAGMKVATPLMAMVVMDGVTVLWWLAVLAVEGTTMGRRCAMLAMATASCPRPAAAMVHRMAATDVMGMDRAMLSMMVAATMRRHAGTMMIPIVASASDAPADVWTPREPRGSEGAGDDARR